MHAAAQMAMLNNGLKQFERNRYFYGKMLDAFHFELETDYHNRKRWLINCAVLGYGVVCGLDIKPGKNGKTVEITPGVAIDKWGREIIVAEPRQWEIDQAVIDRAFEANKTRETHEQGYKEEEYREEETACVQVMLCYRECLTDPAPVLAGDCHSADQCAPGTIRETYSVSFTEHCTYPHHDFCEISHIVSGGRIDYDELTRWITRKKECLPLPEDPCIRLAHLHVSKDDGHRCDDQAINIAVRPIVYTNDLLFEILLGWRNQPQNRREK